MTTIFKYETKKDFDDNRLTLPDQLYDLTDIPEILLRQSKTKSSPKTQTTKRLIKRLSPFLITAFYLPFLFLYSLIKNDEDKWLLLLLLVFTEVNILFMDFALWNYYEGKKKLAIWLIETFVLTGALFLMLKNET